ncbi:MAG: lipoyl(octanoyl) transferase LipB [Deltaproteobacteria bacterium]|nr:lipoyl(octanoyl) transferase LipB [Deltaproteobacteria bacterium]
MEAVSQQPTAVSFGYRFLGQLSYEEGLLEQQVAVREVQNGIDGVVLGLTHDPVITIGRNATRANLLADDQTLAARGIVLAESDRGGDITYHGPEQVLLYPIVRLAAVRRSVKGFVDSLQRAMVVYLASLGLTAVPRDDAPGVYVGGAKIGLLGLRVQDGIARHGLALNLGGALDAFSLMHPCGHAGQALTSVEALTGARPSHKEAAAAIADALFLELER